MRTLSFSDGMSFYGESLKLAYSSFLRLFLANIVLFIFLFIVIVLCALVCDTIFASVMTGFDAIFLASRYTEIIIRLVANLLESIVMFGVLNAACSQVKFDEKLRWNSFIKVFADIRFLLRIILFVILSSLFIAGMCLVGALAIAGLGYVANYIGVPGPLMVICGAVLFVLAFFVLLMVVAGVNLGSYCICPKGENDGALSGLIKGVQTVEKNMSIVFTMIALALINILIAAVFMLPVIYYIFTNVNFTGAHSQFIEDVTNSLDGAFVNSYLILLCIGVVMPFFYAVQCFWAKAGDYIYNDEIPAVSNEGGAYYNYDDSNRTL